MNFTTENTPGYTQAQLAQLNAELTRRISGVQDAGKLTTIESELRAGATEFLATSDPAFPSENRSQGFEGVRHSFGSTNAKAVE